MCLRPQLSSSFSCPFPAAPPDVFASGPATFSSFMSDSFTFHAPSLWYSSPVLPAMPGINPSFLGLDHIGDTAVGCREGILRYKASARWRGNPIRSCPCPHCRCPAVWHIAVCVWYLNACLNKKKIRETGAVCVVKHESGFNLEIFLFAKMGSSREEGGLPVMRFHLPTICR